MDTLVDSKTHVLVRRSRLRTLGPWVATALALSGIVTWYAYSASLLSAVTSTNVERPPEAMRTLLPTTAEAEVTSEPDKRNGAVAIPVQAQTTVKSTPPPAGAARIPTPSYDSTTLYQQVRKDTETHPLVKRMGLDVRIVKIENGYVTLTVTNGALDLMLRMEEGLPTGAVLALFDGRQDILALLELTEAVTKNPGCKGVYWTELPITRAVRKMKEAASNFTEILRPFADSKRPQEEDLAYAHRIFGQPRVLGVLLRALTGTQAQWLRVYEEALSVYPEKKSVWERVKVAVRSEEYEEAVRIVEDDAAPPGGWRNDKLPSNEREWHYIPAGIAVSLSDNLERLAAIKELLRRPRKATMVIREKNGDGDTNNGVLILHAADVPQMPGWTIAPAKPPLSIPAIADAEFYPVTVRWYPSTHVLEILNRKHTELKALQATANGTPDTATSFTLQKDPATPTFRNAGGTVVAEVIREGADPRFYLELTRPRAGETIRLSASTFKASSIVYALGGILYHGHPSFEFRDVARESITHLPDGVLFQVAVGRTPSAEQDMIPPGELLVSSPETRDTALRFLDGLLVKKTDGYLGPHHDYIDIGSIESSFSHAALLQPEILYVLTNDRKLVNYEWIERAQKRLTPSTRIHVAFWDFPGDFRYANSNRGEPWMWRELTRTTKGVLHLIPSFSPRYFWGTGPTVDIVTNNVHRYRGTLVYADAEVWGVRTVKSSDPSEWTDHDLERRYVTWLQVLRRVSRRSVPEAVRKYLPEGSCEPDEETPTAAQRALEIPTDVDTVVLKTGTIMRGTIISHDASQVQFAYGKGSKSSTFRLDEIERMYIKGQGVALTKP